MRLIKIIFIFSTFIFSLTTFATPKVSDDATYTENKINITATEDTPAFALLLKSNPTTGYSWFLRDYDAKLIQPIKHEFKPAKNRALIGAPGQEQWTFHLKTEAFRVPQITIIRLVYARPWEVTDQDKEIIFRVATMSDSSASRPQTSE